MASIYDAINTWSAASYLKNDIVSTANDEGEVYYWYAVDDFSSSVSPTVASNDWIGRGLLNTAGVSSNLPEFNWKPSYSASTNIEPRVLNVRFGDGYEQRMADGINNKLLVLNLTFDKRNEKETLAINHFLNIRGGAEAFIFTPPSPFSARKKFICKKFSTNYVFYDNYTISATFEETPN